MHYLARNPLTAGEKTPRGDGECTPLLSGYNLARTSVLRDVRDGKVTPKVGVDLSITQEARAIK